MTARLAFAITVVAYAAALVVAWAVLPERVPIHFGLDGTADRYDDRGSALLFLVILGVAMAAVLGGLARWAPRVPEHLINMPARTRDWWFATPERERELRRKLAEDLWWIGAMTMALLVAVQVSVIVASRGPAAALSWWFWAVFAAYLLGLGLYLAWMTLVRHRVPPDDAA